MKRNFYIPSPNTVFFSVLFVRRDQSRSIQSDEKNAFVRFISVTHTITSLCLIIPQSLWLAVWNWLLEHLQHMHHGRGF